MSLARSQNEEEKWHGESRANTRQMSKPNYRIEVMTTNEPELGSEHSSPHEYLTNFGLFTKCDFISIVFTSHKNTPERDREPANNNNEAFIVVVCLLWFCFAFRCKHKPFNLIQTHSSSLRVFFFHRSTLAQFKIYQLVVINYLPKFTNFVYSFTFFPSGRPFALQKFIVVPSLSGG